MSFGLRKWYVYYAISISYVSVTSVLLSGCMWDGPPTKKKKELLQFSPVIASEVSETRRSTVVFLGIIHLCVLLVEVVRLWHVRCTLVHVRSKAHVFVHGKNTLPQLVH